MKKILALFTVLVVCLSLCACGKSEAVVAYEELVSAIGEVTLDSEEAILAAESSYEDLTDEEKETAAESYDVLTEKREKYDALVAEAQRKAEQEARLNSVIAVIDAIGDVTVDSEADIIAAETAYNNLPDEDKAMIPDELDRLVKAREAYETAVAEQMAARAAEVSAAINAIGTVTLDSKAAIDAAKDMYNALTDDEKALVTSYSVLQAAETTYASLWEAEKQRIITEYSKKFDIETDPVQGISWYMPKNMPDYIDTRSYIIPYIGVRGNSVWMCIRYNYTGDSWIFWETLTFVVDGEKDYKYVGYFNTTRDNDSDVWEYWDECLNYNQALDTSELELLASIGNSNETIIRFEGDNYYYDLYVSDRDKQMIRETLALYTAMLG